jgi:hypothetical protein
MINGFLMADFLEQYIIIASLFCFKLRKPAAETHDLFERAFSDIALGRKQTFEWFSYVNMGKPWL